MTLCDVVAVVVVCVRCGVWWWHAENPVYRCKTPLCVQSKRLRVYGQHTHMLEHMRFEYTHEVSSPVPLTKKSPRRVLTCAREVHQRNPWMLPIFSLRIGRTRHVPDSSNHSLYLMKLLSSSNFEGTVGGN